MSEPNKITVEIEPVFDARALAESIAETVSIGIAEGLRRAAGEVDGRRNFPEAFEGEPRPEPWAVSLTPRPERNRDE
jgi:hypothetical protein